MKRWLCESRPFALSLSNSDHFSSLGCPNLTAIRRREENVRADQAHKSFDKLFVFPSEVDRTCMRYYKFSYFGLLFWNCDNIYLKWTKIDEAKAKPSTFFFFFFFFFLNLAELFLQALSRHNTIYLVVNI